MDDQQAICDQGPMHCMNLAERIIRLEKAVLKAQDMVKTLEIESGITKEGADQIMSLLQRAYMDLQQETVTEPSRPMKVGWQTWEKDGIELKLWDPAKQEHLENCSNKQRNDRIRELPNAANMLKEGDEVLCGGLHGWYLARIVHGGGVHAETDHYYFPIKWSETQKCWVTDCQINKACFDRFKLPDSPGAQEEMVVTPPPAEHVDITASVRTELEGPIERPAGLTHDDVPTEMHDVRDVGRSHTTRSDQEGD